MMVDDDETSLHRKYGYAIMALSVVVLAVLMVGLLCNFMRSTQMALTKEDLPLEQVLCSLTTVNHLHQTPIMYGYASLSNLTTVDPLGTDQY